MRKILLLVLACSLLLTSCSSSKGSGKKADTNKKKPSNGITSSSSETIDSEDQSTTDSGSDDISSWSSNTYFDESSNTKSSSDEAESDAPITKNMANVIDPRSGGADAEAEKLRQTIEGSSDNLKISGTTYYISPNGDNYADGTSPKTAWKTLSALTLYNYKIKSGDGVLFERGGVYRQSSALMAKTGVSYGAYGKGPKPAIYGSYKNYAKYGLWSASNKKYVWKVKLPLEDAGILVINHGEICQRKKTGLLSLKSNGDFYHNVSDGILYLYCDKGYPDSVYDDIEIGVKRGIIIISGYVHDVAIDNLCLKYTGAHAISGYNDNKNIKISNCEIGWVGGSEQSAGKYYGNGIQFWSSCSDISVKNCWVYQVYDAGLTFQGGAGSVFKNIQFSNNLIQYCEYSVEFFAQDNNGVMDNISIDNNIMQFAGCGFTIARPSRNDASHICGWTYDYGDKVTNFLIKNNIFDVSERNLINWTFQKAVGVTITGNTYYQKKNFYNYALNYSKYGQKNATDLSSLTAAVKTIDDSPRLVKWLD